MATSNVLPKALWVYAPDGLVGTLHNTDPLSFTYSDAWLTMPDATPVHSGIPLASGPNATPNVAAFFENLLPEGEPRKLLGMREQVTTVFGLLACVGGESAGAYTLVAEGESPQGPIYQELTWDQVDVLVHASSARSAERDAIERAARDMPKARMSISGAQFKVLLCLDEAGSPWRPMGDAASTHILKPDIVRNDIGIFASAINETIVMRAALKCGLNTAHVTFQPTTHACLVERYDRIRQQDGSVQRIWQADFCQLLGKQSDVKYEHDGGPSFKQCYDLLQRSVQPAVDRLQLLRWLFFNLCIGNNDSHAKNLSMITTPAGLRLAPFYDLMCTRIYSGLSNKFAFSIAGESEPGKITRAHVMSLAAELGVAPRYLQSVADDVASKVAAAIPVAAAEVILVLEPSERVMAKRLVQKVASMTTKMRKRLTEAASAMRDEDGHEASKKTDRP
jgi:serine/threonine-protein kinase HipA